MSIEKDRIRSVSRAYSEYLERVTPSVFSFARSQKLDKEFDKLIKRHHDLVHDFPKKWIDTARSEYCYGRIFSSAVLLRKFIRQCGVDLMASDLTITRGFVDEPWEYTLFSVEKAEGTLAFASDAVSGDEFVIESENVTMLEEKGARLFWSLMFFNGQCYQSYGIINYFKGISVDDFEYFAAAVNGDIYKADGISGVMQRFPVPFMLLFAFSEIPVVAHGDEEVVYCASRNIIPGFETDSVEGYLDRREERGIIKYAFSDPGDPMRSGTLYVNTGTWDVTLLSTVESRYRELQKQLPYDFGTSPDFSATVVMATAAEQILGHCFPGTEYDRYFAEEESDEEKEMLAGLSLALEDVLEQLKNGEEPDYDGISETHGCSRDDLVKITYRLLEKQKNLSEDA